MRRGTHILENHLIQIINISFFFMVIVLCTFQRECSSTNLLVEYVFHTMCCTSNEKLRYSSYNTLMYLIHTSTSFSSIKAQLHMALVNLGMIVLMSHSLHMEYSKTSLTQHSCRGGKNKWATAGWKSERLLLNQQCARCDRSKLAVVGSHHGSQEKAEEAIFSW